MDLELQLLSVSWRRTENGICLVSDLHKTKKIQTKFAKKLKIQTKFAKIESERGRKNDDRRINRIGGTDSQSAR